MSQAFQNGYIIYYYPKLGENGERVYHREPIAYPYTATNGNIIDVKADESWQDTGVYLEPGSKVVVQQVTGSWTSSKDEEKRYDANGDPKPNTSDSDGRPLPSAQNGVLIGRIGDDGDLFEVGREAVIEASEEGNLQLMMNSGNLGDNDEVITVHIVTAR